MESFEEHANSFVVRLWQEPREIEGAGPEWRGQIEHVQSGERVYFRNLDKMVGFIVSYLNDADLQSSLTGGKRSLLRKLMGQHWPGWVGKRSG